VFYELKPFIFQGLDGNIGGGEYAEAGQFSFFVQFFADDFRSGFYCCF
jgi:hypothetical protein